MNKDWMPVRTKMTIMLGDGIEANHLDRNIFPIGSYVSINLEYAGQHYGIVKEILEQRGTCMVEFDNSIIEWRMRNLKSAGKNEFEVGRIMEI